MELNLSIKDILYNRGIKTEEDIAEFISDKPQKTYDPFLLHHMGAGVDLILSAIENGAKICIYGDYDTDGVTSVSLLRSVLTALGGDVSYYIPSRFDEGYGLNSDALDKIQLSGAELVITVDCGCTSVVEVEHAKEIGLEILITDHHAMKPEIPDCLLINPNHPDCQYPFKSLAGVGVAFKLAQALVETTALDKSILLKNLDLVAIGTIGDIVPLTDENRTLVKFGLRALNITERPGLQALIEKTGLKAGEITSRMVSFVISPHINAAGRMTEATLAARLLQEKNPAKADSYAEEIIECNKLRRSVQDQLVEHCENVLAQENVGEKHGLLIELKDAHEGIIGIVAGKVKETHGVPVLIVTNIEGDDYKGTGRSIDGVNLHEILSKHSELFERFGGHKAACGFTIKKENLPALKAAFEDETKALYLADRNAFDNRIEAEIEIPSENLTQEYIRDQKLLEPFGKDNPAPLVGVSLRPERLGRMGKEDQFLRFSGVLSDGREIKCVDFTRNPDHEDILINALNHGEDVNPIGFLEEDTWNGNSSIKFNIKGLG